MTKEISELPEKDYTPPEAPQALTGYIQPYLESLGDGSRKYEGLESGLGLIDDLIGGLHRFVLMAGMGGVGKSTLAIQMAMGVAEKENVPVIYYSFEMGRHDVLTMAVQNLSKKLLRNEIELRGNDPELAPEKKEQIANASSELTKISDRLYIIDSVGGIPKFEDMENQIQTIKRVHGSENILVILDSVQDIVPIEANQVQAEARTAQKLVELQQSTNATILGIAQKNKSGIKDGGGYTSVMGSVAWIHKPTTVIELIGGKEAIGKAKENKKLTPTEIEELEQALEKDTKNPNTAYPIYLNVIKGRNSGYGGVALKYYGAYRYYEVGKEKQFEQLYKTLSEVGLV
jgi:KaiC/GvpD/RAD55 family RecA-like ATPase